METTAGDGKVDQKSEPLRLSEHGINAATVSILQLDESENS